MRTITVTFHLMVMKHKNISPLFSSFFFQLIRSVCYSVSSAFNLSEVFATWQTCSSTIVKNELVTGYSQSLVTKNIGERGVQIIRGVQIKRCVPPLAKYDLSMRSKNSNIDNYFWVGSGLLRFVQSQHWQACDKIFKF